MSPSTIGVLGGKWRATVTASGSLIPWDGSAQLDWFIAADDRWHTPHEEAAVRQRRVDGAPVYETRVRIPSGDALQRIWAVADGGGLTLIEVSNESPLPIAVAFNRSDLLSPRAPSNVPIEGISLPAGSVVFPIGHHSSITVALGHDGVTRWPGTALASVEQVVHGWTSHSERAGRVSLPDAAAAERLTAMRCELALLGPVDPHDDPIGFVIGAGHLVRLGERAQGWVPEVAEALSAIARLPASWDQHAAYDAATLIFSRADERRALRDLARLPGYGVVPASLPVQVGAARELALLESSLARPAPGGCELLAGGFASEWLGTNFEVFDLPAGAATTVSYAIRWHGERPAVLWECSGDPVALVAPAVAGDWTTLQPSGEALWPAPIKPASLG